MKKITLLLMAFVFSTVLMAQETLTPHQQEVQQTVIKMFEALSKRDSVGLKTYSTADISLYEYGQVWTIDTLILKAITLNQSADFKRTNSFEFINTNVDKTTAWVTYRLQSVVTRDGKLSTVQWLETVVLVKLKKQWKVKHLHSTLIRRS
ncbi:nuclear transport factor 2 family protein [Ferruginibacter sp. SUN106]|uniref:nuclear transport factor 2 family protein n=1 Tax=Ferruginibacter sp. SUN106 TaxID=2978348 RepID=UPI003D359F90